MSTRNRRHFLHNSVPRAGFRWPRNASLLSRSERDRIVSKALQRHGNCPSLAPAEIESALASMYTKGKELLLANPDALRGINKTMDFVTDLWEASGSALSEPIFTELFAVPWEARKAWKANPRLPKDPATHGVLAHAIDAFEEATNGLWNDAEVELLLLEGSKDADEEEGGREREGGAGNDPAAAHTQSSSVRHAAGEPTQEGQVARMADRLRDLGLDEDGDVTMTEE